MDDLITQTCNQCLRTLAISEFYVRPRMKAGFSKQCKRCEGERQKRYTARKYPNGGRPRGSYRRSRAQTSAQRLWTWHRLRPEQYGDLLAAQGGRCAICGTSEPGGQGRFHVDHDHSCCPGARSCGKCVRGLLCSRCNPMIGMAKDDPEVLMAAVEYLKSSAPASALGPLGG